MSFRHILFPTDGSRLSSEAADAAIGLSRALGARLTVLHVVPHAPAARLEAWAHGDPRFAANVEKSRVARGVLFLEEVRERAMRAGITCECRLLHGAEPHREIVSAALEKDCDLIVMASHRMGSDPDVLLDGETIKVLTRGRFPVLVCH